MDNISNGFAQLWLITFMTLYSHTNPEASTNNVVGDPSCWAFLFSEVSTCRQTSFLVLQRSIRFQRCTLLDLSNYIVIDGNILSVRKINSDRSEVENDVVSEQNVG